MQITVRYYEEEGVPAQVTNQVLSVDGFLNSLGNYYVKELEQCKLTKTSYHMQANEKNGEGCYLFEAEGTQAEIEELAQKFPFDISWSPEFILVAKKGLKVLRNSDNQLMFITNAIGYHRVEKVTLCSPMGEILELAPAELYSDFTLSK